MKDINMWKNTDPRLSVDNSVMRIILVRADKKFSKFETTVAFVDTKTNYSVLTGIKSNPQVLKDEKWNPDWFWTFTPNGGDKDV